MGVPFAEVIGDPVAHSKSPLIHKFWLEKLGIAGDYGRTRVAAGDLAAFIAERRGDPHWRGCNVTMPLKQAVIAFAEDVDPHARGVGALNALYRSGAGLAGANTDILGILDALPADAFGSDAVPEIGIIGAGGAARALLAACRQLGVGTVHFMVRNPPAALALLREWRLGGTARPIEDVQSVATSHVLVNASPLGMRGKDPMPRAVIDAVEQHPTGDLLVFDMVYDPLETELLAAARRRGLRTVDGLSLLIAQARHAFRLFFGAEPPAGEAELRELLAR